jgi:hypothetical protein
MKHTVKPSHLISGMADWISRKLVLGVKIKNCQPHLSLSGICVT